MKLWKYLLLFVLLTSFLDANTIEQKDIEQKWKASPAYEKFLQLKKSWKSKEAEELQTETITKIANEVLKLYVKDFKDKFEDKMSVKVEALPFGLKTVLADAYTKGKVLLSLEHMNEKDLNKFVWGLFWYVDSIHDSKGITEKKAYSLEKKFPELKGTKYMDLLINLWKSFDTIDESQKNINESQKNINESQKNINESQKEIDKWDEIIERLKSI